MSLEGNAITEYASLSGKIHTLVIDKTLSISGAAADAKKVGQEIERLDNIVPESKEAYEEAKAAYDEAVSGMEEAARAVATEVAKEEVGKLKAGDVGAYSKEEVLATETKTAFGLGADAVPNDVLAQMVDVKKESGRIKLVGEADTHTGKATHEAVIFGGDYNAQLAYWCISPNRKYLARFNKGTAEMYLYRLPDMELIGTITTSHSADCNGIVMDDNFGCIGTYTNSSSGALEFFKYTDTSIEKVTVTGISDTRIQGYARYCVYATRKTNPNYFWVVTNKINASNGYVYTLTRVSKSDKIAVSMETGTMTSYSTGRNFKCFMDGNDGCYILDTDYSTNSIPWFSIKTILTHYDADGTATTLFSKTNEKSTSRVAGQAVELDIDGERVFLTGTYHVNNNDSYAQGYKIQVLDFSGNLLYEANSAAVPNVQIIADDYLIMSDNYSYQLDTLKRIGAKDMCSDPYWGYANNGYTTMFRQKRGVAAIPINGCYVDSIAANTHYLYPNTSHVKFGGFVNE